MEKLKLNETPVRTSRNFNINNIKLEDVVIPEKLKDFSNVQIINPSKQIAVENLKTECNLKYGVSDILKEQVEKNANQNLKITIDGKSSKTLEIDFKFDNKNSQLVENIDIEVKENATATVILKYTSCDENCYFHNGIIKVRSAENSNVTIIIANLINIKSNNFLSIDTMLKKSSNLTFNMVEFGGKNNVVNYYSNLLEEKANNTLNGIYLGKENQLIDLNYIAELRGEKANIDIEVQGALSGTAKKHFKGTIDFKKGCKKSIGNENEACMLLSDTAKSLALPMLLCSEEDVEGNHSSSSGKADEKELFYIMTRGFSKKEAMKLLVRARFNKLLESISDDALRNEISFEIDKRLD
jgi:Fe-S cluster assembly scaffold protein SufB